jgi:hypothetical protein
MKRIKRKRTGFRPRNTRNTSIGIRATPLNLGKPTNLFGGKGQKPSWFSDKVWKTEVITKDGPREPAGIRHKGNIRQMDISKKVDFFGGSGRKPSWFGDSIWSRNKDSDFDGVADREDCNPRNPWLQDEDKGRVNFEPATRVPTGENFEESSGEFEDSNNLPTIYEPKDVEETQQSIQNTEETGLQDEKEFITYIEPESTDEEPEIKNVGGDFTAQENVIDNDTVDVPEDESMWYLYYRLEDGKWYLDNAYNESELQSAFQRLENYPGIVETRVSKDDILKQLNRQLGLKNVGDTLSKAASKVGDYTERQQFKGNLQQQLRPQSRQRHQSSMQPSINRTQQPSINIYQQERRLPPNGNSVGRVQRYSPVTAQQSTVPQVTRQYQPFGSTNQYQNPNYDMGVQRKVTGLHKPNPMSINLSNNNAGTGLGQKRKGSPVTRPKFMIPVGDIKFLRFGRRLE